MTSNQHDRHRRKRLFEIGALEFSEGVERLMNEGRLDPMPLFERHMRGDWGDVADNQWLRIPRHPATQSTLIWPGIPRPSGHLFHGHPGRAVGAQRRRAGIVSPGWLASSISASVCALIHPSD